MIRAVDIYVEAVTRRNDVLGEGIVDLVRASTRSIARLYRFVQTERRRRASIRNLNALNDHLLRDIGLTRQEIPAHVKQHMAGHAVPSELPSPVQRVGQAARAAVAPYRWLAKTYRARRAAEHLRELPDRRLRDIGIARHEIDMAVRGRLARGGRPALVPAKPRPLPERSIKGRSLATPTAANDNRDRTAA